MKYLLDVSSLIALLWQTHSQHERVKVWELNSDVAVCPIAELGFVRILTQPAFGANIHEARQILEQWLSAKKPTYIPCDLRLLEGAAAPTGAKTTDFYLASLAEKRGMKFATLDENIKHPAVFLITN